MMENSHVWAVPPTDPGHAAEHFKLRLQTETDSSDLHKDLKAGIPGIVVVDARSKEAYERGHIPGAISLPHRQMNKETTAVWSKENLYVVYCWNVGCNASLKGAFNLSTLGFKVKELMDGLRAWEDDGFQVALGPDPGSLS
jgi:rhodanese-related sulfurtransferase